MTGNGCSTFSVEELLVRARSGGLEEYLSRWLAGSSLPFAGSLRAGVPEYLVAAAGSQARPLAVRLAVSALLTGKVEESALQFLQGRLQLPLAAWADAFWLLVDIPCLEDNDPHMVSVLAGHSTSPLPAASPGDFMPDSQQAVNLAVQLAVARWGGHALAWNWSGAKLAGESLGLPLFLFLSSAANRQAPPAALASGRILSDGRVAGVSGIDKKFTMVVDQAFFIPEENYAPGMSYKQQVIPVRNLDAAWFWWKACGSGRIPKNLAELLHALDEPEILFQRLPGWTETDWHFLDRPANHCRVRRMLLQEPTKAAPLGSVIREVRGSKKNAHRLARKFLTLFDPELIRAVGKNSPILAWRLSVLRVQELNHDGWVDEVQTYADLAVDFSQELGAEEEAEELIAGAVSILVARHNRYHFSGDPLEALGSRLCYLYEDRQRAQLCRLRDEKKPADRALGDLHGALGQHLAYQGNWRKAEELFDKALPCFTTEAEKKQTVGYQFFNHLEAGNYKPARAKLEILWAGPELSYAKAVELNALSRLWALFALTRYQAEAGNAGSDARELLERLSRELSEDDVAFGERIDRHPWQLIAYNLGRVVTDAARKQALWKRSLSFCLAENFGPTIRAMALLPLSALHQAGLKISDRDAVVGRILKSMDASLYHPHFQALFKAGTTAEVLTLTARKRKELFPFNYR